MMRLTEPRGDNATHKCHGILFERKGDCNRCGACGCERRNCPHFSWDNGLATCSIQDTKEEVCTVCTKNKKGGWYREGKPVTHQQCEDFPEHPFLNVIRKGECNYTFTPINKTEEDKIAKLNINYKDD